MTDTEQTLVVMIEEGTDCEVVGLRKKFVCFDLGDGSEYRPIPLATER